MHTIHQLSQLTPTPAILAKEAATRIFESVYFSLALKPRIPSRIEAIHMAKSLGPKAYELIREQPLYKSALWLAKQPTKHHKQKEA